MTSIPEGTPILCRTCGGGMRLEGDTAALCPYCGAKDVLPADEAGRHLEFKNRLALARSLTAQVKGMDAALARIFEDRAAFLRVSGLYLALGGIILMISLGELFTNPALRSERLPRDVRGQLVLGHVTAPLLTLGIGTSFGVALLGGRMHFRRKIRPFLLARPINMGGAAFACRTCGAPLAIRDEVSVNCQHCTSVNLVPKELQTAGKAALNDQAAEAARTVQQTNVRIGSIAKRMEWILAIGFVASFAAIYVLPGLVAAIMGWK
jgi:DNA-directed RNA polymerase subunit RPC12/RpoP